MGSDRTIGPHDSPRWCQVCGQWGHHHTDRHGEWERHILTVPEIRDAIKRGAEQMKRWKAGL